MIYVCELLPEPMSAGVQPKFRASFFQHAGERLARGCLYDSSSGGRVNDNDVRRHRTGFEAWAAGLI